MKKCLIIMLSLLLACSAVFAVEGTGSDKSDGTVGDKTGEATALVTLDLSGGSSSANYWEIGFSKEPVVSATSPTEDILKSTNLVLSENAMTAEDDEHVYVYWIIKGGQELKISLSASGALSSSSDSIDWQISWDDEDTVDGKKTIGPDVTSALNDVQETVYTTKQNIHTRVKEGETLAAGDYGSVSLDISTEDFSNKKAENYQATLILTIADASSN